MANSDIDTTPQNRSLTSGQWFILVLLMLLNAAVIALLILALSGQLAL